MIRDVLRVFLTAGLSIPIYAAVPSIAIAVPSTSGITMVLPANTPGLVYLNAKPEAWMQLKQFYLFSTVSIPSLPLLFLPEGIDFTTDIQPWLGEEIAIALLPARSEIDSVASNTILMAPVRDRERLTTFIDKLRQKRGQPQIERDYQGVTILQWATPRVEPSPTPSAPEEPDLTPEDAPQSGLPLSHLPVSDRRTTAQRVNFKALNPNRNTQRLSGPLPLPPMPGETFGRGSLAIALLPGHLAVASQVETLENLIDARSKGPSLAENPLFQRTLNHPQVERSLLVGYGNAAAIAPFIATLPELPTGPIPIPLSAILRSQIEAFSKTYNTVDVHLWVQPEGLRSQTNAYYVTPRPDAATIATPDASQILNHLPAATYLSANSRNLKQQWQQFTEAGSEDFSRQLLIRGLRQIIQNVTSLDLEKDLVPWMDGEYAFFLFPTRQGLLNYIHPDLNLGMGLMVQTSDRAAAEAALKKVDQWIKSVSKNEVAVVSRQIKGQPMISWEGKERGKVMSVLAHGWINQDMLIITTGVGPIAELSSPPLQPLQQSYPFAIATQTLPTPNEGYFYVNTGAFLSFLYYLVLPQVPDAYFPIVQQVQTIVGSVRSIVSTNSATTESQRVDGLLMLAPAKDDSQ